MKLYGIMGLLLLLAFTPPANAGIDEMLTAITNIEEGEVEHLIGYALYQINYFFEVWNEGEKINITPERLNISEDSCLVYIDANSSNVLGNSRMCLYHTKNSASFFQGGQIYAGLTIGERKTISLRREIYGIDDFDPEYFPDGNINLTLKTAAVAPKGIFADHFGGSINLLNNTFENLLDETPENYGDKTGKTENILHFRLRSFYPNSILTDNTTYTQFNFNVTGEILNGGEAFETYNQFPRPDFYLDGDISFHGTAKYSIISGFSVNRWDSQTYWAGFVRMEGHFILTIQLDDMLVEELPNGQVEIWYHDMHSDENALRGYIYSEKGGLTFSYDDLPPYWTDYPLVDQEYVNSVRSETMTNLLLLQGIWLAIILIPINKRKNLMK